MNRVRLTAEARADLLEIWAFHAESSIDLADRILRQITDTFDLLESFPESGRLRDDLGLDARGMPVNPYVIFYRPRELGITILRVVHGARDFSRIFPPTEDNADE